LAIEALQRLKPLTRFNGKREPGGILEDLDGLLAVAFQKVGMRQVFHGKLVARKNVQRGIENSLSFAILSLGYQDMSLEVDRRQIERILTDEPLSDAQALVVSPQAV
jgi:hypothetical protein